MNRKLIILVLSAITLTPVLATDAAQSEAKQIVALQNGETLYIFKDGLMAKEDKWGRAVLLRKGEAVQTADGKTITTMGNESARLSFLLNAGHGN